MMINKKHNKTDRKKQVAITCFLCHKRKENDMCKTDSFGIYVHIPFCVQKCRYCDFLSFADKSRMKEYVEAVRREIRAWHGCGEVSTIYFGGGTPSVLPAIYIEEILNSIRENFRLEEHPEITIECKPGTADSEKFSSYINIGINRLSMGLQSAVDQELKLLGRIHSAEQFVKSYEAARKVGFTNISVDIMSALPGQTLESYRKTLELSTALHPEHISAYSLIIEEGTPFYRLYEEGKLILPDEDCEREMYYETKHFLQRYGYERYEISNYARPGYESRHNSSYWTGKNYLGIGLGASSLMQGLRFKNTDHMGTYLRRQYPGHINIPEIYEEVEILSPKARMEEFMFLGLRMMKGISVAQFEETFGKKFEEVYGETCRKLVEQELLNRENDRIRLTEKGIDVSNMIFSEFL